MRQPLHKIEAVDSGGPEVVGGGARSCDRAAAEIGMIVAAGRVVFLPNQIAEPRPVRDVARRGA